MLMLCSLVISIVCHPQFQAVRWVRAMEQSSRLESVKMGSTGFVRTLETCVRLGRPLLIESCPERLDPVLENVSVLTMHS
jgi:dynein heavy chain